MTQVLSSRLFTYALTVKTGEQPAGWNIDTFGDQISKVVKLRLGEDIDVICRSVNDQYDEAHLAVYSDIDLTKKLVAWFAEGPRSAPFPEGTLLLYNQRS